MTSRSDVAYQMHLETKNMDVTRLFGLAPREIQMANLVGTAALCLSTVAIGAATDQCGIRRVSIPILFLMIAVTYGLYFGAEHAPSALLPLYALAGFGAGGVVLTPILMIRAFPPQVRFTGVSFSYNIAYAVFGGLTPLVVSWLARADRFSPAHYIAVVTMLGLAAIFMTPTAHPSDRREKRRGDALMRRSYGTYWTPNLSEVSRWLTSVLNRRIKQRNQTGADFWSVFRIEGRFNASPKKRASQPSYPNNGRTHVCGGRNSTAVYIDA